MYNFNSLHFLYEYYTSMYFSTLYLQSKIIKEKQFNKINSLFWFKKKDFCNILTQTLLIDRCTLEYVLGFYGQIKSSNTNGTSAIDSGIFFFAIRFPLMRMLQPLKPPVMGCENGCKPSDIRYQYWFKKKTVKIFAR